MCENWLCHFDAGMSLVTLTHSLTHCFLTHKLGLISPISYAYCEDQWDNVYEAPDTD